MRATATATATDALALALLRGDGRLALVFAACIGEGWRSCLCGGLVTIWHDILAVEVSDAAETVLSHSELADF
eukprot:2558241-Pleurochrysis_carterae.AAC.1